MKKVNQCSDCGGFCSPKGCERENVPILTSHDVQRHMLDRIEKMERALKVISIWALHPDENTLDQIRQKALEALGK